MFTTASVRTVAVGGQLLRTCVRPASGGAPGQPPLLLINGIGASLDLLQPFVDELDPALEVIRFDVPGVGGSPAPSRPYRFTGLCGLIAAMLTELGYDTADVLGISWGGALAQQFALTARGRCRRLVLVATGAGMFMVPGHPRVILRLATPRRYTQPDYFRRIAGRTYGGGSRRDPDALLHGSPARFTRPPSFSGYLAQLYALAGWTSMPWLRRLPHPTLVLSGDDDPIVPLVNGGLLGRLIPDARLEIIDGGGHLFLLEEPKRIAFVVTEFLT